MNEMPSYMYFAEKDLQAAQAMLEYELYSHCVRLCQQYIEKCFKEAIDRRGSGGADTFLLHTHKVQQLAARCSEIFGIKFTHKEKTFFKKLTDYYFDTNYPSDDYVEITAAEAAKVMEQTLQFQAAYEEVLCKTS